MSESSSSAHSQTGSDMPDERFVILQRQVLVAFVAINISLGALFIYLFRQDVLLRRELGDRRPQINNFISEYQKVSEPQIKSFAFALQGYARTNAEFNTVLQRYRLDSLNTPAPAVAKTP